MDKIAIIELNTSNINLLFADVIKNKSYLIYDKINVPCDLFKDFKKENIIKSTIIKEVVNILSVFKNMIDAQGITETICIATAKINDAKNQNGFLNEIFSITNLKFNILTPNDEINFTYNAVVNSFNKPKALIINVGEFATEFLLYNRRNVLNTYIMPYGCVNLKDKFADNNTTTMCENIRNFVKDQIKDVQWICNLEEDYEIIGAGNLFLSLGEISRRAIKYPLNVEHNYEMNKLNFEKVYNIVKNVELSKNSKIKGVSLEDTQNLPSGLGIVGGFLDLVNKNEFAISKAGYIDGILLTNTIPLTLEKPMSDNLGYSLQVLNEYYDKKPNNAEHVYNLSMILFKQLKVLHKLNRSYVRVLRIASYMSACGLRVTSEKPEKVCFNIILNSQIYGVSHTELVLAAFVALLKDADNFNLSEWVRYKDLVNEDELVAVKKLAVILEIASNFDCTKFGNVVDVSCDILGDSVIMKTITKNESPLEINQAKLCANNFKKAYNKNLEIL